MGSVIEQADIETGRLLLRAWRPADAPALHRLAGRRQIADTMISIPHPYAEEAARAWIAGQAHDFAEGRAVHFALERKGSGQLVGAIELRAIDREHAHAELSLWIGVEWWGQGYASEAALAVVRHGFDQLGLNRIYAYHMARNPASGRVLDRIGLRQEGLLRQCVRKWGRFEDVVLRAIVREDWKARRGASRG